MDALSKIYNEEFGAESVKAPGLLLDKARLEGVALSAMRRVRDMTVTAAIVMAQAAEDIDGDDRHGASERLISALRELLKK